MITEGQGLKVRKGSMCANFVVVLYLRPEKTVGNVGV